VASYDVAGQYSYTDYLATFDGQWNLTRNIFVNDDGTRSVVNYDVQNQYSWSWETFSYDSNWNLLSRHGQNDDTSTFGSGYLGPGGGEGSGHSEHEPDDLPAWIGTLDNDLNSLLAGHPQDWLIA